MPTLKEHLELIAKDDEAKVDWTSEKARAEVLEAVKTNINGLYTAINNQGFNAATAAEKAKVAEAEDAKKKAEADRDAAQLKLREMQDKAPDVKTVNQQWETQVSTLKADHQKALEAEQQKARAILHQRDQQALENLLLARNLPASLAKKLSKFDNDLIKRLDYDANGSLSVLQAGQSIPFTPGQGQTHLSLLADEIAATVEDDIKRSNGDRGSGVAAGNTPGKSDDAFFKGIQDQAKKEQSGPQRVSLEERFKNRG